MKAFLKGILVLLVLVLASIGGFLLYKNIVNKVGKTEVITESSLYEIINVSELSTYQCVYNGICTVMETEMENQVSYYCAYEARVNAGIEFDQVELGVDEEEKIILITLPVVEITDVNVDISTLDYMFVNKSANKSTISERAYKACIVDAQKKSAEETKIYELAQQNAENTILALVKPFVEQLDNEFTITIQTTKARRG